MREKKNKYLLTIIAICILMHLVFIIFGNLQWETNDDEVINLIAAGAWGIENSHHLVYQNIIAGWFFKLLYAVFPGINVYVTITLILNSLSVCMLCGMFARKHSLPIAIFVTVVLNLILYGDFFSSLQYTKNAILYAITGWIYLACGVKENAVKTRVAGYCFLAVSFIVRWNSCLFTAPFAILLFVFETSGCWRSTAKACVTLAVIFAALIAVNHFGNRAEWGDYVKYNEVRTDLLDFGFPDYTEQAEVFEEHGLYANDFEVMKQWNYGDNKVFSYENISVMDSAKSKPFFSFAAVTDSLGDIYSLTHTSFFPAVLFALTCICLLLKDSKRTWEGAAYLLVILFEYVVLHNNMRVVWRVELGIWIVPIIFLLLFFENPNENYEFSKRTALSSVIVSIGIVLMCESQLPYNFLVNKHRQIVVKNEENRFDVIQQFYEAYPDAYLLGDTTSFSAYSVRIGSDIFDITRTKYGDKFTHFSFLGGWIYPSPLITESQNAYGIDNPIECLLKDNVYYGVLTDSFYETEAECLLTFLREHYEPNASYEVVDHIGEIDIIKFNS